MWMAVAAGSERRQFTRAARPPPAIADAKAAAARTIDMPPLYGAASVRANPTLAPPTARDRVLGRRASPTIARGAVASATLPV
jgi:hypothetical protein